MKNISENLDTQIQNAKQQKKGNNNLTEKDKETMKNKLKALYQVAKEMSSGEAMKLATEAESEEERKFYAFIMTMNLQRNQKKAIERNLF